MPKPILVLDFDGVMHGYQSGWQGADVCADPPVPGLDLFLGMALPFFEVHVHSSRSSEPDGRAAMREWCMLWLSPEIVPHLHFPEHKPPAMVTLDDRALTFDGVWPEVGQLLAFVPWTKNTPPPNEAPSTHGTGFAMPGHPQTFRDELAALLNKYSLENGSDTPDFLLASYLEQCLLLFGHAVQSREQWYGRGKTASIES